jgi:hypothetical protein
MTPIFVVFPAPFWQPMANNDNDNARTPLTVRLKCMVVSPTKLTGQGEF